MSDDRPTLIHLTTTDMSLALLLGPQLRAFVQAGYRVIGASAVGPYREEIEELGVEFVPVEHATRSMAPGQDALALVELTRLFRRLRPDIVHTHNPKPGLYGRLAARAARVPHVVNTVHGLYALPEDRAAKRRLVYALERVVSTCSDAELVQNPEDVEVLHRIGIPARKVRLLGNGIDLDRFDRSRLDDAEVATFRAGLLGDLVPTDHDEDLLLCGVVGRLVWEKGLREVFEAAEALRTTHPDVRIVVIGPTDPAKSDGLTDADLAAISAETGVVFAGERRDMELVYASLDLFALASYREGFPRAAMEASAMGVPVVATDIRGCRQVVDDGVTGLLVPARDGTALAHAIASLADDADRRASMGRAARTRSIQNFDQQQVIDTTLTTYRELLDR
ncbi:glycosyltransferase family 4 protein [soil metagenome]